MSSNLGTLTYGNLSILPGYDVGSAGPGNLIVSGTLLAASAASLQGTLSVVGAATLSNNLTVNGNALFNSNATFNGESTFTGPLIISNTTDATDPSSGALQVEGGLGVLGSTHLDGTLALTKAATLQSTLDVTGVSSFAGVATITNTTEAAEGSIGALVVAGGLNVASSIRSGLGNLYLADRLILNSDVATGATYLNSSGGSLYINDAGAHDLFVNRNSTVNFNVADALSVSTTGVRVLTATNSTSPTTGGLIVSGGMGVAKSVQIGGDIIAPVGQTLTIGNVVANNTAQSTSVTTGAIQTSGGLAVAKNAYLGGYLDVASADGVGSSIGNFRLLSMSNGANYLQSSDTARTAGQWTPLKFGPLDSQNSILTVQATHVTIDQTTAATSAGTGALVVAGGVGVGGNVYIDGTTVFNGVAQHQNATFLNNQHLYLGVNQDESHGLVYSADVNGPLLFGMDGGALGTVSNAPRTALTWNATREVQVHGTTETTSTATGALTVAGGVGIAKSVNIGTDLFVQSASWTSANGADIVLSAANSSITLRNENGNNSGAFESTLTDFSFRTTNQPGVATYKTLNISKTSGHVTILNTDDANGVNTGSLQLSGGQSIAKTLYVGDNVIVSGDLQVAGSISTSGDEPVVFSNTADSVSPSTGSVVISGGAGIAKSLFVGGIGHFTNTASSTDTATGALVVSGGLGLAENINVGGFATIAGTLSVTGTTSLSSTAASTAPDSGALTVAGGVGVGGDFYLGGLGLFTNTAQSTSATTGSVVISGGLGIAKDTFIAGVTTITSTIGSTDSGNGALVVAGGVGIAKALNVAGNTTIAGNAAITGTLTNTGTVHFLNTVDSTSPSTGSLVIDGGLGVGKSVHIGSTAESTAATAGALTVEGGLGVGKNITLNGNQTFTGANPLLTFNTSGNAPPAFTTRSTGTRITLQRALGIASMDYAIGMDADALWQTIPVNTAANRYDWYAGQDRVMSLDGTGVVTLTGTTNSTSTTTGTLAVAGGAGFASDVYIGGLINVANTALFSNNVTANANLRVNGIATMSNTTDSVSDTTGSLVVSGGLGVRLSTNIGGNLSVTGTQAIQGDTSMAGLLHANNTTDSTSITTGSVIVAGGVGIGKTLHVGGQAVFHGNATIAGNLTVTGTRTEVRSTTLTTTDNVIVVNNGPSGSSSAGFAMKRFQAANDASEGDVIADVTPEITGTATGGSATTIVLDQTADATDGHYDGAWVQITSGTGNGQVRRINTYAAASRTATIYTTADAAANPDLTPVEGMDWTTAPDATSVYAIYTANYVLSLYDEVEDAYILGSSPLNPATSGPVPIRSKLDVQAGSLTLDKHLEVDTITNYRSGTGTTVEGILHRNTEISGVSLFNGGTVDVTSDVVLDGAADATVAVPATKSHGSYMILVSDSMSPTGANCSFLVSGSLSRGGHVIRLTSVSGSGSEQLTIQWQQGGLPTLRWIHAPDAAGAYHYRVKVISVV